MKNINCLPPFKLFVLQNFPFVECDYGCISNEELLCKIIAYIEEISKNQNDLYNKYDYIYNYFKNLDVQEEINNKLDEMAESGELENLILKNTTKVYNTLLEIVEDENLKNGQIVETLGYHEKGDKGNAKYYITDIQILTNKTYQLMNGLYANLIIDENTNILKFGAKENEDISDILTEMQIYLSNIYIPRGRYKVLSEVTLNNGTAIIGEEREPVIYVNNNTAFNLIGRNTIKNLIIHDDTNNIPTEVNQIIVTPAFIRGTLAYSRIENVSIGNAYIGMDLKVNGSSHIKSIKGYPLKYGIKIDNSVDIVYIDDVDFNPNYFGTPTPLYLNYCFKNAYAFYIGRADWGFVNNVFAFNMKGLVITETGSIGGSANNFTFNNFGVDACFSLASFPHNGGGFKFINGTGTFFNKYFDEETTAGLDPVHADAYALRVNLTASGTYETKLIIIENCAFYRGDGAFALVQGKTNFILKNCYFKNMHGTLATTSVTPIINAGGNSIIDSNTFINNPNAGTKQGVLIGNTRPIVTSNRFIGFTAQAIVNTGSSQNVANNNVDAEE